MLFCVNRLSYIIDVYIFIHIYFIYFCCLCVYFLIYLYLYALVIVLKNCLLFGFYVVWGVETCHLALLLKSLKNHLYILSILN